MKLQVLDRRRLVEAMVMVPHGTDYRWFDHTDNWSEVVFSNGKEAIECKPSRVWQDAGQACVTVRLKQPDYERLSRIVG